MFRSAIDGLPLLSLPGIVYSSLHSAFSLLSLHSLFSLHIFNLHSLQFSFLCWVYIRRSLHTFNFPYWHSLHSVYTVWYSAFSLQALISRSLHYSFAYAVYNPSFSLLLRAYRVYILQILPSLFHSLPVFVRCTALSLQLRVYSLHSLVYLCLPYPLVVYTCEHLQFTLTTCAN